MADYITKAQNNSGCPITITTTCKNCQYCETHGRQQSQRGKLGRKKYFCYHPRVNDLKDKFGRPVFPFVGFGDMSKESPLVLKTRKKWCPMEEKDA